MVTYDKDRDEKIGELTCNQFSYAEGEVVPKNHTEDVTRWIYIEYCTSSTTTLDDCMLNLDFSNSKTSDMKLYVNCSGSLSKFNPLQCY